MIEKIQENKKIISLFFIAFITVSMFVIYIYSYFTRDTNRPTVLEKRTMNLRAREILNEKRTTSNILSNVDKSDLSNFLLTEGADIEFQNVSAMKEGASSDNDKSREYGLNSSFVTSYRSHLRLYNSDITTKAPGANGIYTLGTNAISEINDTDIVTEGIHSSALSASTNGQIDAYHLTIKTKSIMSPALDTITKDSKINISNSLIETNGAKSPIINATGNISVDKSTGTSSGSNIAILKDTGDVYIHDSTFIAAGGVPEGFSETGVLIYSDGSITESQNFASTNSSLNIDRNYPFYDTASLFYVEHTNANIRLTNSSLNFGSNVLAYIKNSNVFLYASGQKLTGNIIIDNSSTLEISLKYESSYETSLNSPNVKINLGINAQLVLNGDMHIGGFNNENITNDNVITNGYHLYVNDVLIK